MEKNLLVFHGSSLPVPMPDLRQCSKTSDFGQGFYVTTNRKQAIEWGAKKSKGKTFAVTSYTLDITPDLSVKEFKEPDKEWLYMIIEGRQGKKLPYDIVIGPVGDARIRSILDVYVNFIQDHQDRLQGEYYDIFAELTKQTIDALKIKKDFDQFALLNEKALDHLYYKAFSLYDSKTKCVIPRKRPDRGRYDR